MCVYFFGYISLFCNLEYYENYYTIEEISLSLVRCNYLRPREADFPYQEQSEKTEPIILSL